MGRASRCWVALAIALAAAIVPAIAVARPTADDIELVSTRRLDPRLVELTLRTPALTHQTGVRVLLPEGYRAHPRRRYPVLYLLHGSGGSETDWTTMGDAEQITAGRPLIVVMPDTDQNGYYSDWYNAGNFGPPEYETYDIDQLIPWIDSHYRTIARRRGRAVAGLSMGGFGALSYAARHPDMFVSVAGFSPAANTNYLPFIVLQETGSSDGDPTVNLWGDRTTQEVRWRAHNPWDLAANYRGLQVSLRYGNGDPGGPYGGGDPIEAGVHEMSTELDRRLTALGIPHLNDDYGPGGHAWDYWQRDLTEELPLVMKTFSDPPPRPRKVEFRAVEPRFEAYGWHVRMHRKALEFAELAGASRHYFRIKGSGSATVRTPACYPAGKRFVVSVTTAAGVRRTERLRSSRRGRLRIAVPLGPANPDQEYTAQAALRGTDVFATRVHIERVAGRRDR